MKTLTILLIGLTVVFQVQAQKEFLFARTLQTLDQKTIDNLHTHRASLSASDITEWTNFKAFYENPYTYLTAANAMPIDMKVLNRLQKIATTKESQISLVAEKKEPVTNKESYPASVLPAAEIASELIYAMGQLLIDRAKQELYASHFQQLTAEFDKVRYFGNSNPRDSFRIRDLLPNSYLIISNFNTLVSPQIGQSLQTAFEKDLLEFHTNMCEYLIPDNVKSEWTFMYLTVLLESIEQLTKGNHPSGVLKELSWKYHDFGNGTTKENQLALGLNLMNALSESLLSNNDPTAGTGTYWIEKKDFLDLDVRGYEYYVCLFYLNHQDLFTALGVTKSDVAEKGINKYQNFKHFIEEVLSKINWVELKLKSTKPSSLTNQPYDPSKIEDYVAAVVSLFDLIQPFICEYKSSSVLCSAQYKTLRPQIDLALTIPADIRSKNYSSVFLKSYRVGNAFYTEYTSQQDFAANSELIRYLTLANDIVQADSAEAMKNVLDAAIMPVGSYQIKRNLKSTIGLNAFVGVTAGYEQSMNPNISPIKGMHIAPFAPIGLDFAWATKNKRSNSIYLVLVDLGAVVNMYFNDTDQVTFEDEDGNEMTEDIEVKTLPELSFSNIFAPGLFFTRGAKKSPLTAGLGIQLAPDLRELSLESGADISAQDVIRFSFFLAVDIPLFTFSKGAVRY